MSEKIPLESLSERESRPELVTLRSHPCPLPRIKSKWRNQLYICECGQGWRLVQDGVNYASGPVWIWEQWPK